MLGAIYFLLFSPVPIPIDVALHLVFRCHKSRCTEIGVDQGRDRVPFLTQPSLQGASRLAQALASDGSHHLGSLQQLILRGNDVGLTVANNLARKLRAVPHLSSLKLTDVALW
jgi:hypothetical protein